MGNKTWLVITFIFLFTVAAVFITSAGGTAFNHFELLANSFLHGKIYIDGVMPWLEKIPINENQFYVANPPMPAILLVPFVYLFGPIMKQEYLSYLLSGILSVLVFLISWILKKDIKIAIWSSILVIFGTINWYLASIGSTWYIAHIVSETFLFTSILLLLKNKNPFFIGLMIGFSYLSRIPTILTLPFFLINIPKPYVKNCLFLFAGIAPAVLFNFWYNYVRFGVIWDIGYTMIPGVSTEPWYIYGVINLRYIPDHLKIIFTTIPNLSEIINLSKPSLMGYAIWFTTPAFIFSLFNNIKEKIVWSSWLSILLVSLLIFSHGSTGFSQFGYRFATDFYPLLIFLTIKGVIKTGIKWQYWILLISGTIVNFWPILTFNIIR